MGEGQEMRSKMGQDKEFRFCFTCSKKLLKTLNMRITQSNIYFKEIILAVLGRSH